MASNLNRLVLVLALLWPGGWAAAENLDRIVAVVDDKAISQSEVDINARAAYAQLTRAGERVDSKALWQRSLEELINRRVRESKINELKITVTDKDVDDVMKGLAGRNQMNVEQFQRALAQEGVPIALYREDVRDKVIQNRIINKLIRPLVTVSAEEVKQARAQIEAEMAQLARQRPAPQVMEQVTEVPVEVKLGHILMVVPPDAGAEQVKKVENLSKEVAARLRKGESFATLASKYSDDSTAMHGGEMGWFKKGEMMPQVESAMFSLPKGAFIGPVRSNTGFHIFRVLDQKTVTHKTTVKVAPPPPAKPTQPMTLTDTEIESRVIEQKGQARFHQWMRQQRQLAFVEFR